MCTLYVVTPPQKDFNWNEAPALSFSGSERAEETKKKQIPGIFNQKLKTPPKAEKPKADLIPSDVRQEKRRSLPIDPFDSLFSPNSQDNVKVRLSASRRQIGW